MNEEEGRLLCAATRGGGAWFCTLDKGHEGIHFDDNRSDYFKASKNVKTEKPPTFDMPTTEQGKRVLELTFLWWEEFNKKNADYQTSTGNVSENFGLMGQYMKLTDKIHKLRTPMWDLAVIEEVRRRSPQELKTDIPLDKEVFNFEGTEEILRDIIGHCFLALDFIEQKGKK